MADARLEEELKLRAQAEKERAPAQQRVLRDVLTTLVENLMVSEGAAAVERKFSELLKAKQEEVKPPESA